MSPDYVPKYGDCVLPYVQWYQDDFLGGVRGMRAAEIGIYTILLNEMYARGTALNMSDERLARLCGADLRTFVKALEALITEGKIIRLDCGLWNGRCENAFEERAKMREQNSLAGKESAKKRNKNKGKNERPLNARSTPVQPSSEAQNTEAQIEPNGSKEISDDISLTDEFPTFWQVYPKRVSRRDAEKSFVAARNRSSFQDIMDGARRYADMRRGQDPKYTKNPSTWLNQDCWSDEIDPVATNADGDNWRNDPLYAGVE